MAKAKNTPEGYAEAEEWYKKALGFDEQNYQEKPCYNSRRALSVTYEKLGNIAKNKNFFISK